MTETKLDKEAADKLWQLWEDTKKYAETGDPLDKEKIVELYDRWDASGNPVSYNRTSPSEYLGLTRRFRSDGPFDWIAFSSTGNLMDIIIDQDKLNEIRDGIESQVAKLTGVKPALPPPAPPAPPVPPLMIMVGRTVVDIPPLR
jgi:hypothetical protein